MSLILPARYRNLFDSTEQTEKAIKAVKDMFQSNLSAQLALLRVTAPMVVPSGMGLNDDLNGVEPPRSSTRWRNGSASNSVSWVWFRAGVSIPT